MDQLVEYCRNVHIAIVEVTALALLLFAVWSMLIAHFPRLVPVRHKPRRPKADAKPRP